MIDDLRYSTNLTLVDTDGSLVDSSTFGIDAGFLRFDSPDLDSLK